MEIFVPALQNTVLLKNVKLWYLKEFSPKFQTEKLISKCFYFLQPFPSKAMLKIKVMSFLPKPRNDGVFIEKRTSC